MDLIVDAKLDTVDNKLILMFEGSGIVHFSIIATLDKGLQFYLSSKMVGIFSSSITINLDVCRAQQLITLKLPVLVWSLNSSNVELSNLDGSLAANPERRLDLISRPILVVGFVLMQS